MRLEGCLSLREDVLPSLPVSVAKDLKPKTMKCTYIKTNGEGCGANAMKNSKYCFTHNPETRDEHSLAVVKGGKLSKKTKLNLPPVQVRTPIDIIQLLEETINGIRDGSVPPTIAKALIYACSTCLKAMESANLSERLEMVESVLLQRKTIRHR